MRTRPTPQMQGYKDTLLYSKGVKYCPFLQIYRNNTIYLADVCRDINPIRSIY